MGTQGPSQHPETKSSHPEIEKLIGSLGSISHPRQAAVIAAINKSMDRMSPVAKIGFIKILKEEVARVLEGRGSVELAIRKILSSDYPEVANDANFKEVA